MPDNDDPAALPAERRAVGGLEAEALALLQAAQDPLIPAEVQRRLGGTLAYSTVVTILTRMYNKGLLKRTRQGRAYAYAPVADAHGLTARRMRQVLEGDPDREAVLSRFVEDLPSADERLLRQLLGTDLPDDR